MERASPLERSFTSQLTILDEQPYREGIQRIEATANLRGHDEPFMHVDLQLHATYARKRT